VLLSFPSLPFSLLVILNHSARDPVFGGKVICDLVALFDVQQVQLVTEAG
jgi:hypothetical protein